MSFSSEDKVIIKHYRLDNGYGIKNLLTEFQNCGWTVSGLRNLTKKIDQTGSIDRKSGNGGPRSAEEEILSQEINPG